MAEGGEISLDDLIFKDGLCCLCCEKPEDQRSPCGHSFCDDCVALIFKFHLKLGLDATATDSKTEGPTPPQAICPKITCKKNLEMREFKFLVCICSYCKARIKRKDLLRHMIEICEKRPIICQSCGLKMIFEEYQVHFDNSCESIFIECELGCGQTLRRSEMVKSHYPICKNRERICKYSQFGCTKKGAVPVILQHENEFSDHSDLFVQRFLDLKCISQLVTVINDNMNKLQNDFKNLTISLKENEEKIKEMSAMQRSVDENQKSIKEVKDHVEKLQNSKEQMEVQLEEVKSEFGTLKGSLNDTNERIGTVKDNLDDEIKKVKEIAKKAAGKIGNCDQLGESKSEDFSSLSSSAEKNEAANEEFLHKLLSEESLEIFKEFMEIPEEEESSIKKSTTEVTHVFEA